MNVQQFGTVLTYSLLSVSFYTSSSIIYILFITCLQLCIREKNVFIPLQADSRIEFSPVKHLVRNF
jgi:hypothetical protein